jgi:hypothetical protein
MINFIILNHHLVKLFLLLQHLNFINKVFIIIVYLFFIIFIKYYYVISLNYINFILIIL